MTNWQYFKWSYAWERKHNGRIQSFMIAVRETFKQLPF